ncbi:alpha/beta hydrolase [Granulicella cerasi]|uniref:Alpha/beta hydrolase n=1 Tax=Granulicella cerasi TaxID=741063 RepID=A0ABW1Z7V6_9BACT|nr:alpha/beta hydrolase [Granulicella cerasi]
MPKSPKKTPPAAPVNTSPYALTPEPQTVDPMWLLKALGVLAILAFVCAYLSICGLFWKSQWQLVLHPFHGEKHTPADAGLLTENVSFGPDSSGQPQLRGWWIAADNTSATVLMLPSGDGSAGDWTQQAKLFHDAHLNVLLFDYRGVGQSQGHHPTMQTMREDATAALAFLNTRQVAREQTIVFGGGSSASIATQLCGDHHDLAALVLFNADGDFAARAKADPRSHIVPFSLLFNQGFPLADPLNTLATPKLLLSQTTTAAPEVYKRAASPKMLAELPDMNSPAFTSTLTRFLDMYTKVKTAPATLQP